MDPIEPDNPPDWHTYEARKAAFKNIGISPEEYTLRVRQLCDELGI